MCACCACNMEKGGWEIEKKKRKWASLWKKPKRRIRKNNMKGPEGICGATCALLYTFLLLPPPFKERKKEVKRISIWSLLHNNPKFYFDQIGVAYTCTASRWLYHNMSKSHSWLDGTGTCRSRPGVDLSPAHQPVYVFPLCDATTHTMGS